MSSRNTITTKNIATVTVAIAIAALLVGSVLTMYTAEAKSKSKHGTIKVEFISAPDSKGKLKIINDETGKVIVSADLNFKKQFASQGDNCCHKTYEFKWKGNHVGDELTLRVKADGFTNEASGNLKSGTTHLGIDLNNDDD